MSGHPLGVWWCEAYGPPPEGDRQAAEGAWPRCFLESEPVQRRCPDPAACSATMAVERVRVHARIHELAADGDPVAELLAADFPTPDGLLNARDE